MKPLKAHPYVPRKLKLPCFVQRKYNGVRALYQNGIFYSSDEIAWQPKVLAHLTGPLATNLRDATAALDGELYVHGWSLQQINSAVAVKRGEPSDVTHHITFVVFDLVAPNTPFIERYAHVSNLLRGADFGKTTVAPTYMAHTEQECNQYYEMFVTEGFEGAVYRLGECPYTFAGHGSTKDNRVLHMLKRKFFKDSDFTVVDVVEGRVTDLGGKYVGTLGSFLLRTPEGILFNAAPAFNDAERLHYFRNPPVGKKATVKYLNLSDKGIPLNPTVLTIREA